MLIAGWLYFRYILSSASVYTFSSMLVVIDTSQEMVDSRCTITTVLVIYGLFGFSLLKNHKLFVV